METLTAAHYYFDLGLFTAAWETLDVLPVEVRESNEAALQLFASVSFSVRSAAVAWRAIPRAVTGRKLLFAHGTRFAALLGIGGSKILRRVSGDVGLTFPFHTSKLYRVRVK